MQNYGILNYFPLADIVKDSKLKAAIKIKSFKTKKIKNFKYSKSYELI